MYDADEWPDTDDRDADDEEDELHDPGYHPAESACAPRSEHTIASPPAREKTSSHHGETAIVPDLVMAQRFLDLLEPNGLFHFQSVIEKGPKKGGRPRVLHGTLSQHANALTQLNRDLGAIWVQINRGTGREACDITWVRSYFVDCDKAVATHFAIEYSADMVVETSPGKFHYYWLTAGAPLDQFKLRQQALVARLDGDKNAVDLSRVMRLPGFFHTKAAPFMSRLVYVRGGL